jgi:hypothetical protein
MPFKPSDKEEEYFLRKELETKRKFETEKLARLNEEEKLKLKELHYMCCPKCGNKLLEINYSDIMIDKCSNCDGIWLDAGELEQVSQIGFGKLEKLLKVFGK